MIFVFYKDHLFLYFATI